MVDNKYKTLKIRLWKLKNSISSLSGQDSSWNGLLTISITFAALIISLTSYQSSIRDSRTDLYISFKERFHDIRKISTDYKTTGFDS